MNTDTLKVVICMLILGGNLALGFLSQSDKPTENVVSKYFCDYKVMSFNTEIKTTNKNGEDVSIEGNILTWLEDPLTMRDKNGNAIAYAGDSYNLISQNDHGIYLNGEFVCDVVGRIKVLADSYELYDNKKNLIAYVEFNMFDTVGKMYDKNGVLIAQYISGYVRKDYTVYIFKDNKIDEDVIQMIFASYVSDKEYDNNSN